MCGVFGYVGSGTAVGQTDNLLRALRTLEYRGYDSWGIAVAAGDRVEVEKRTGRINGAPITLPSSPVGFGHTRWATHGGVTAENAHPHLDCTGRIAIIHNGIVENHRELRQQLAATGHRFASETDSEVIAHLLEDEMSGGANLRDALSIVFERLAGFNAVVAIDAAEARLAATKNVSPLVAGVGPGGAYVASDAIALEPHAQTVHYLEDGQVLDLAGGELSLYERSTRRSLAPSFVPLSGDPSAVALGPYRHFMAKEMAEQPQVLRRLASTTTDAVEELAEAIHHTDRVFLVGCGTAANAARVGQAYFAELAGVAVHPVFASEFGGVASLVSSRSLVVALSQSGETLDVVAAMLMARDRGAKLGAIVNVERSTLDRMVDLRIHLGAGPEQCVLATKSYSAKVGALLMLARAVGGDRERAESEVEAAADAMAGMLSAEWEALVDQIARSLAVSDHLFAIGRGLAYPTALEAALKIKEVSYIHAEGFAGGELKHGVIALVTEGTPCLVFVPDDDTRTDSLSSAAELKSRGAKIIGVAGRSDPIFDAWIAAPDLGPATPIVHALAGQMLAYRTALARGTDPDRPRNLAKSVTVK